jgi:pullulanase/glycogen debranching enzyme
VPVEDDDLLLLMNAGDAAIEFRLPEVGWQLLLDTAAPGRLATDPYYLEARSLALLVKAR